MIRLDYECRKGHRFEKNGGKDRARCPICRSLSEIIWLSPSSPHRQFQDPIVMWKYSDGSLGVAGGTDSRTPKGAERIEIRSLGEYRTYAKELNNQLRSREEKREEGYRRDREKMESEVRSNLSWMMGQESDPTARDIYRAALERVQGGSEKLPFSEYFSMVTEMDSSNLERD